MALDLGRWRTRATTWLVVIGLGVMVLGLAAFVIAFRPCRLGFSPGQMVTYRLTTTVVELDRDGKPLAPRETTRELSLVCVGSDNEVALVTLAPAGQGRDEVTLLSFSPDGTARCLDAAARPTDAGKAIGFFDFNLLPLPPDGANRPWEVSLVYAALPPAKRQVQAKVKRIRAGSSPEFQLRFPASVEWINERNRYMQIRDLVCTYQFNSSRGLIDAATVKLLAGVETDAATHHYQVTTRLQLAAVGRSDDDPRRMRDLALATAETGQELSAGRSARLGALIERLQLGDVRQPHLRELARRLAEQARSPGQRPPREAPAGAKPWAVLAARGPAARRAQGERFRRELIAAGFPARLIGDRTTVSIVVGPYAWQDPGVIAALAQRFPGLKTSWVEAKP